MSFPPSRLQTYGTLWQQRGFPLYGAWAHPYYIWTPDYSDTSSGIRVLYYLCHILNSLGYEAFIWPGASARELRTPTLTQDIVSRHKTLGLQPIVVYPEIVEGNPLNARVVVRYLLFFAGFHSRKLDYASWELVFSYLDDYVPDGLGYRKLFIPCSDTALFNSDGAKDDDRRFTAFYANRFLLSGQPLMQLPGNPIELSPRVPQKSLAEIANIFRRASLLYSYEWSSICLEAMLCGCPVVLVPNRYLEGHLSAIPRRLSHLPPFNELYEGNGLCIGLGEEAVQTASRTVGKVKEVYARRSMEALPQLETFLRVTQAVARRIRRSFEATAKPIPAAAISPAAPDALRESCTRFRALIDSGDCESARKVGAEIEQLLAAILIPEIFKTGYQGQFLDSSVNDDLLALTMIVKPSGYCFLRAQHLLSLMNAPDAAAKLFRLTAELCEQNLSQEPVRFSEYEALLANAMYHECIAMSRAGRIAETRARAAELLGRTWSNPIAASICDRLRKMSDQDRESTPRQGPAT